MTETCHAADLSPADAVLAHRIDLRCPTVTAGYSAEEALGRTPRFLQGPRTDRAVLDRIRAALVSGEVFEGQSYNYRKDGSEFLNEWHIEPVFSPTGAITHYLAIQRDITERKLMEKNLQQAQKMESMWLMAGGIAHDFNNILSVVIGYGGMALRKMTPESPGYADLTKIVEAGEKGINLTKRLLRFSRKEQNLFQKLQVNALITDTVNLLQRFFPKNIRMLLSLEPALPEIEADQGQIEQLLLNTAINARDAMPKGGTLTFATAPVSLSEARTLNSRTIEPGEYVQVDVSDTGEGMTDETKAHLFQQYFTTKAADKGTGLGLTIIRSVLEQHSGGVEVLSELGKGTTFRFLLPVKHRAGTT